jgi:hypothetical protein
MSYTLKLNSQDTLHNFVNFVPNVHLESQESLLLAQKTNKIDVRERARAHAFLA